jgi:F-type H+-transporting ATPase subunit delta
MATQTDTLSRIYASSLYELADEAGGRDKIMEIADELEQICDLVRSDRQFREMITSPVIDASRRTDALGRIFGNRVTDLVVRFLIILNQNGRLGHLESIQAAYDQQVQEALGRIEVDVITALEIDAEARDRIGERIKQALGKEPVMHTYTDPSIIGGVRLRIGDEMIDGSVATRLRRMGTALQQNGSQHIRTQINRFLEDDA